MAPDDSPSRIPSDHPSRDQQFPASEAKPADRAPGFPAAEQAESRPSRAALSLRCPVCRARQPLQPTCRRCQADLRLLVAALREVDRLQSRHAQVLAENNDQAAIQIARQLERLQGRK